MQVNPDPAQPLQKENALILIGMTEFEQKFLEAFGAFTSFNTIAATVAVVACARYEFALPMARSDAEAATLMALCLRIGLLVTLLSLPLAAALHLWGKLPLPGLLPVAVASAGVLQLLVMWNTRARQYRVLAISRVL